MEITAVNNKRIFGLDAVRAIAILSVVIAHTSEFLYPLSDLPRTGSSIHALLDDLRPLGPMGVELFFVLSGFLIGNILIKTYLSSLAFSFAAVKNFWVRRWFRTLPNYWLVLTINIVMYSILKLNKTLLDKLLFYPFLQNLITPHPRYFFGEAWSLSVEEWFYLTLPIALYALSAIFKPSDKVRFLLRVFIGYLVFFIVLRFINAFHPIHGSEQDAGIRKVVILRLDAVMYGVLFAYFNYFKGLVLDKLKYLLLALSVAGASVYYYLYLVPDLVISSASPRIQFFSDAFFYMVLPLLFACCLPFANGIRTIGSKWLTGIVQYISKVSYSMYLVHYSLVYIPFFYTLKVHTHTHLVLAYLAYLLIVFVLSSLLYRYVEQPAMRYRDKVTTHK